MENKLFSPVLSAANNIVKSKRPLSTTAKDYNDFVNWLDTSNKELKKVKLPTKKKVETLASSLSFDIASSSGGGGIDLLGSLLGGAGALGAGLGLRGLFKGKKVNKLPKEKINEIEEFPKEKIGKIKGLPEEKIKAISEKPGGRFGGIGGALNVGLTAFDFFGRKSEGQSNLQAGVGAGAGLAGGIGGGEIGSTIGGAIGILGGPFAEITVPLGAAIGGLVGSYFGGKYAGKAADKLTGANKIDERLKAQEKKQKEAASRRVTFPDVINKFDKVVSKFEKFTQGFGSPEQQKENYTPDKEDETYSADDFQKQNNQNQPDTKSPDVPSGENGKLAKSQLVKVGKYIPDVGSPGWNEWYKDDAYLAPNAAQAFNAAKKDFGGNVQINSAYRDYAHQAGLIAPGAKATPGHSMHGLGLAMDLQPGTKEFEWFKTNGPKYGWYWTPYKNDPYHFQYRGASGIQQIKKDKKGTQTPAAPVNTVTKQQSIEEFIKGTKEGDRILKDPKLKAQLTGQKYQFKGSMETTPVTDPEVKQAQQMYNAYVRDIRSRQKAKVIPSATPPAIPQALMEDTSATGNTTMIMQQPSATSAGGAGQARMIPVPIGGGGGGGSVISGPSEGQIVNSLLKAFLLTNLSGT